MAQRARPTAASQARTRPEGNTKPQDSELPQAENLEQVREILFGAQHRSTEEALERLEGRLIDDLGALRNDLQHRYTQIEHRMQQELDALRQRLQEDLDGRREAVEQLDTRLNSTQKGIESKLHQLGVEQHNATCQLREQLHSELTAVREHLVGEVEALGRRNQTGLEQLRSAKIARESLAAMFSEMAARLNGDVDQPLEPGAADDALAER